jgi:hypothetical protein
LYDLKVDPYQLNSLHASPDHLKLLRRLHVRLQELEACSGQEACEAAEGRLSKDEALAPPKGGKKDNRPDRHAR